MPRFLQHSDVRRWADLHSTPLAATLLWGFLAALLHGAFVLAGLVLAVLLGGLWAHARISPIGVTRAVFIGLALIIASAGVAERSLERRLLREDLVPGARVILTMTSTPVASEPFGGEKPEEGRPAGPARCRGSAVVALPGLPGAGPVEVRGPCAAGERDWDLGDTVAARVSRVAEPWDSPSPNTAVLTLAEPVIVAEPAYRGLREIRSRAERAFGLVAGERSGRVAAAMVYGGAPGNQEAAAAMKAAGLSHLTAVSGANCAVVTLMAVWTARLLRLDRRWQFAASVSGIGVFIAVCGPEATVLRASVMGALGAAAVLAGRGRIGLAVLGAAVILLLAADPWMAVSLGFGLSVSATAGIVLWSRRLAEMLARFLPLIIAQTAALAISASVACQPLLSLIVTNVPGLSLPANMAAAPLTGPITALGFLVLPVASLSETAGALVAWLPSRGADLVVHLARLAALHPANQTPLPVGRGGAVLSLLLCAALWMLCGRPRQPPPRTWSERNPVLRSRALPLALWSVACALLMLWLTPNQRGILEHWQAALCDVGQGDALVLRTGGSSAVLVDAGPREGRLAACLQRLSVTRLEAAVITHLHEDHYGGLAELPAHLRPERVLFASARDDDDAARLLGRPPEETERITRRTHEPGAALLETGPLRLELVRAPPPSTSAMSPSAASSRALPENAASLVVLASIDHAHGVLTVLSTGDIEESHAGELLAGLRQTRTWVEQGVDAVKTPHHGASNGIREASRLPGATVALIGVGAANGYGHPHDSTLALLAENGTEVRRTDRHGHITLREEDGGVLVTGVTR